MAAETPKPTANGTFIITGVSDDSALDPRMLRVDPSTNRLKVDSLITGGSVSIDTTGLATGAGQTTGNNSLSSIDTKIPAQGQALAAASTPVVLTAAQLTTLTPPAAITNFANETGGNLATVKTNTDKIPAQGQALAASSTPVVLTAAQITTLTPPAAITGFATSANQLANNHNVVVTSAPTTAVTGTFFQATQPVSLASVPSHAVTNAGTFATQATLGAETTKVIGTINIAAAQTLTTVTTVGAVTAISNALPAGTNAIGKLSANSGVDIGDVDVTTVGTITPGTAAANLGKAEDGAHTSGDVGVFALGVRNDTLATGSGTTGDYTQISTDLKGRVMVGSAPRNLKLNQVTTITASAAETTIVTAVASTFLDLYGLIVTNTSATAVTVALKDASASTTRLNIAVPAGDTRGFMLPIDAAIKQTAVNNNWTATTQSVTSVIITALTVSNV